MVHILQIAINNMEKLEQELSEAKSQLSNQGTTSSINATIYSAQVIGLSNELLAYASTLNADKIIKSNENIASSNQKLTIALVFLACIQIIIIIVDIFKEYLVVYMK